MSDVTPPIAPIMRAPTESHIEAVMHEMGWADSDYDQSEEGRRYAEATRELAADVARAVLNVERAQIAAALRAIPWYGAAANAHTHADMIEKGEI